MSKYTYISILVESHPSSNNPLNRASLDLINERYNEGWEFVDSAPQAVGGGSYSRYAPIVFTLRKLTIYEEDLLKS